MSLDNRMANFGFLYDDDGPHLNPHILEKLKPEQSNKTNQKTENRLGPDLPFQLVGTTSEPLAVLLFCFTNHPKAIFLH